MADDNGTTVDLANLDMENMSLEQIQAVLAKVKEVQTSLVSTGKEKAKEQVEKAAPFFNKIRAARKDYENSVADANKKIEMHTAEIKKLNDFKTEKRAPYDKVIETVKAEAEAAGFNLEVLDREAGVNLITKGKSTLGSLTSTRGKKSPHKELAGDYGKVKVSAEDGLAYDADGNYLSWKGACEALGIEVKGKPATVLFAEHAKKAA